MCLGSQGLERECNKVLNQDKGVKWCVQREFGLIVNHTFSWMESLSTSHSSEPG